MCDISIARCICETVDIPRSQVRRDAVRCGASWFRHLHRDRQAVRHIAAWSRIAVTGRIR